MERITIRSADLADVERLVELLEYGSLADPSGEPENAPDIGRYRAALVEIQATPGNDVLVAEIAGEVVGTCQLVIFRHFQREGGLCCEIESVHVHPDFRSKGIGSQLMASAVDVARQAGCYRVQLTSNLRRPRAHQFYEREGFQPSHIGFKRLIQSG
jgi:GNAT superfamily N-acetyltransferase